MSVSIGPGWITLTNILLEPRSLAQPRANAATAACSASIAALAVFVLKPGLGVLFAPVMATLAHLDTPERYVEPYSWKPLFIIYATFIEAVVATFLIAALTWPRWGHEARFDLASSWRSS